MIFIVLYNLLFPVLFTIYLPFFLSRLIRRGHYREGFCERFGVYAAAKRDRLKATEKPVWIHAVSVGEAVAALSFISRWTARYPDLTFVISTTTSTGQHIVRKRAPENVIPVYFPLDFYPITQRAIKAIAPRMIVIFEVEIWPNIITCADRRNIPITLVNARMSDNSARGYRRYRSFFGAIFSKFALVCTQTQEDARRIRDVTGERAPVHVCNTMKFDQDPGIPDTGTKDAIYALYPRSSHKIFVAASTHPGEEKLVLDAVEQSLGPRAAIGIILVPRHAERTPEIESILKRAGRDYILFTDLVANNERYRTQEAAGPSANPPILVVNTTGEMLAVLAAADIVFMGNSLAGHDGGHNIIEPALFGKPIIFGTGMKNFRLVAQIFKDNNACIEVADGDALKAATQRLLRDSEECSRLGKAAKRTIDENRGAIDRTITLLQDLVENI